MPDPPIVNGPYQVYQRRDGRFIVNQTIPNLDERKVVKQLGPVFKTLADAAKFCMSLSA